MLLFMHFAEFLLPFELYLSGYRVLDICIINIGAYSNFRTQSLLDYGEKCAWKKIEAVIFIWFWSYICNTWRKCMPCLSWLAHIRKCFGRRCLSNFLLKQLLRRARSGPICLVDEAKYSLTEIVERILKQQWQKYLVTNLSK